MNFAGPMLMAVQSMAVAAPFLNEIRAKDHEIAFLRAKIAALGGHADDLVPLELPEVEISQNEWEGFLRSTLPLYSLAENLDSLPGGPTKLMQDPGFNDTVSKLLFLLCKVLAKMFIKLTQIPMIESHDPESFYMAFKNVSAETLKDVNTTIFRPLRNVIPKADRMIAIMEKIYSELDLFDREIRDYSGALFKVLDQNGDDKISSADLTVYTDLFLVPCPDDQSAKEKFKAIFDNLDLNKSGSLSQDEISSFVSKIVLLIAHAMIFSLTIIEVCIVEQADTEIEAMMDFYIQYSKEIKFHEVFPHSLFSVVSSFCKQVMLRRK